MPRDTAPRVALFVTCLVDLFRPAVGFAAVKLLEGPAAGSRCRAARPAAASRPTTRATAPTRSRSRGARSPRSAGYDYVVVPVGLLRRHAQEALSRAVRRRLARRRARARPRGAHPRADRLPRRRAGRERGRRRAAGARDLPQFLLEPARARRARASPAGCSRACAAWSSPSCAESEVCCGFGGTFCVKYPEISTRMVDDKVRGDRGDRRRARARRRPRLPDEHRRPPEAARLRGRGAARRRGPGRAPWPRRRSAPPETATAAHATDLARLQGQRPPGDGRPGAAGGARLRPRRLPGQAPGRRRAGCPSSRRCATRPRRSRTTRSPISTSISRRSSSASSSRAARSTGRATPPRRARSSSASAAPRARAR